MSVRKSTDPRLVRVLVGLLVSALAAGLPGSLVPSAGCGETSAASPAAGLAVGSAPSGAAVFVDGRYQGETPLKVERLTPGDHLVRVVKDGFEESSRRVSVFAGKMKGVNVDLARRTSESDARYNLAADDEGHGTGKKKSSTTKWLLIGAGVAAAGAGVYLALPKNKPPTVSSVEANPAVALMAVTSVAFRASGASDPDGDALTYTWDFGDGSSGSGETTTHVYAGEGTYQVSVTVSDGKKEATASGSVTVRSLTGAWSGLIAYQYPITCNLTQNSTRLQGSWKLLNEITGSLSGSVTSDLRATIVFYASGFEPFTFTATVDSSYDEITGRVSGSGFTGEYMTLRR